MSVCGGYICFRVGHDQVLQHALLLAFDSRTLILRVAPSCLGKQGITILSSCHVVSVDLDQKYLKVKRIATGGNGQLEFGDTVKVGAVLNAHFGAHCRTGWMHQYQDASKFAHSNKQRKPMGLIRLNFPSFNDKSPLAYNPNTVV